MAISQIKASSIAQDTITSADIAADAVAAKSNATTALRKHAAVALRATATTSAAAAMATIDEGAGAASAMGTASAVGAGPAARLLAVGLSSPPRLLGKAMAATASRSSANARSGGRTLRWWSAVQWRRRESQLAMLC